MTPPPIKRLPSPDPNAGDELDINQSDELDPLQTDTAEELDLQDDLGLDPDLEYDEDGAPIIKRTVEEPKVNILDQIENEIQEKIKSQEAAKAAEKAKLAESEAEKAKFAESEAEKAKLAESEAEKAKLAESEAEKAKLAETEASKITITEESKPSPSKSPVKLQVVTEASEIKSIGELPIIREDSKLESPNPEGGEPQVKKIKVDETPPQETNQPGTPIKSCESGQTSLSSTNGYNPVDQPRNNCVLSPPYITSPTSQSLGPVGQPTHQSIPPHQPNIPYSTQSAPPQMQQANPYHVPISHHDPGRMHPNQPYPYEPMPNREHYYPMQPPIPNQPPMMQPMQPNFYPQSQQMPQAAPFPPQQHQQIPPPQQQPPAFPNQKQSRFFPFTGYATPIHTFNDTVEPGPTGQMPVDYWTTMSCTVEISNCPLNCCHVRAHQEIMEGSTNWKAPYGPPLNGLQPCSCCINS